MLDELEVLKTIHQSQKKWRRMLQIVFVVIILLSSVLFVLVPKLLPPMLMQVVMLLSMASVFGLFFLDRISFQINKKKSQQEIMHKYLFQHLKPEDVHKDSELVIDLISKRRQNSKATRSA